MPLAATHDRADPPSGAPSSAPTQALTPGELVAIARTLYPDGPLLRRTLQHHRPRICPFEALLACLPDNASVLDVGCGPGLFLGLAASTTTLARGVGFDVSAPAIDLANDMATRIDSAELTFEHRAVQDGYPDGTFDAVCMIDVMHHVPPGAQEQAFRDAAERVRPGGVFLYKDMCERPMWRALMNRAHDLVLARDWIHYAPIKTVESWGASCGLTLEKSENHARLWYGHELRLFRRPIDGPGAREHKPAGGSDA